MDKPTNHPHHHGPRRGQRGFRGRGRQFDRHSGTHPDSERKVAKAWGEPGTEEAVVDSNTPVDEKAADKVVEAEPVEVEPPVKTLEEYLAEKATITKHALPAPRKANEGEDGNKWKNAVPLVREEVGELFPEIAAVRSCSVFES